MAKIAEAVKMQEVSREISYQLPTSSAGLFKDFFHELDQNIDNLGIDSYGVGITTLEEVFLRIGHGEADDDLGASPMRQAEKDAQDALN